MNYPIGAADLKKLTGRDFNRDEFVKVPQYFFMGGADDNDATEYRDCYLQEDAQQIWNSFGRQMPDRWLASQAILESAAPNVKCKTYPGIIHTIDYKIKTDVLEFWKNHWDR